jgi:hypothetical protein
VVSGFEIVRESRALALGLRLAQRFELFAALEHQLVFILGRWIERWGSGVVRHEVQSMGY